MLGVALLPFAHAQNPKTKDEGWSQLLPPGDGRQAVLESCTTCHNLKVVVHARLSRAGWTKDVNDMIQRGAPLFPEEIDPLTAYLSKVFGPDVPKLVNVNTAAREDLEKLPNLKPEMVIRIVEARPFKNSEELRRALGMEKTDIEKIQYLFKYRD
jgi:DNA uptake protein ComE-like DNA-binding protein